MDDKKLDKLFKESFSSRVPSGENDWDEFEVRLHKKMFFRFSWNRFNIYYMSLIFAAFFGCLGLLSYEYYRVQNMPENVIIRERIIVRDSIISVDSIRREDQQIIQQNKVRQKQNMVTIPVDSANTMPIPAIKDTTTPVQAPAPVILKRKRTVYLNPPPDTLIKVDTLEVKKKRKNK